MAITYLLYLTIVSFGSIQVLKLIDKIRTARRIKAASWDSHGNSPYSEESRFNVVLIVIGSSLWSVVYFLFSEEHLDLIREGITDLNIALDMLKALLILNIAGAFAMLSIIGLMALPLFLFADKLMRLYGFEDKQRLFRLLGTCLLLSNIGISAVVVISWYIFIIAH